MNGGRGVTLPPISYALLSSLRFARLTLFMCRSKSPLFRSSVSTNCSKVGTVQEENPSRCWNGRSRFSGSTIYPMRSEGAMVLEKVLS